MTAKKENLKIIKLWMNGKELPDQEIVIIYRDTKSRLINYNTGKVYIDKAIKDKLVIMVTDLETAKLLTKLK